MAENKTTGQGEDAPLDLQSRIKQLESENAELRQKMGLYNVPAPITQAFEYDGKKYRFDDGHTRIRVGQEVVSTEGLLAIAAGKKVSKETIAAEPNLAAYDKESAEAVLASMVDQGYGYLKSTK